jgi:hypothetical protein
LAKKEAASSHSAEAAFNFTVVGLAGAAGKLTICSTKNVCQLEGSDHGGRDSAAELALAGTIDVQVE